MARRRPAPATWADLSLRLSPALGVFLVKGDVNMGIAELIDSLFLFGRGQRWRFRPHTFCEILHCRSKKAISCMHP